jgi:ferrochelatase
MAAMQSDAVLLVAHGTVRQLDELPGFLTRIRRGRPPDEALLQEIRSRYELIGGSPLLEVTRAQGAALSAVLGLPVRVAMRLWHPFVEEVLPAMVDEGWRRIVVLPAAPFSVGVYFDAALRCAQPQWALELTSVLPWGLEEPFLRAHLQHLRAARAEAPGAAVVLTAHSLPLAAVQAGDRYDEQVQALVAALQEGLPEKVHFAYQSQGQGGGPWLGPDLRTVLEEVARQGARDVVLAPIGFLTEHVETLYDLDVEGRRWCEELGLVLHRVPALGTDPGLIEAMACAVRRVWRTAVVQKS